MLAATDLTFLDEDEDEDESWEELRLFMEEVECQKLLEDISTTTAES